MSAAQTVVSALQQELEQGQGCRNGGGRQQSRMAAAVYDEVDLDDMDWREDERTIKNALVPVLGTIRAKAVTRADVRNLLDRIAVRAPVQANRVLACIRKIYNWESLRIS